MVIATVFIAGFAGAKTQTIRQFQARNEFGR